MGYWKFVHRDAPKELTIRLKTLAEELTAHLEEYREHISSHNSAYLWEAMRQKPEECIAAGTGYECNHGEYKADIGGCICENMFRKNTTMTGLNGALYSDCEVRDLNPSCENHDLQLIVHPFNEQVGGEPEYNWGGWFVQNQLRYKPYKTSRAKWNFRISPFFPGQAGSDDVSVECPGLTHPEKEEKPKWSFMRAIHGGIRFEGYRGFHERFRLIPHGTEGWFYIWTRNEQKYIWLDKDHDYGQATVVTHKKPDGGLFRIQKGTYDCAPYSWVRPPPMGEVTRTERVNRMKVMQVTWTTTSTKPTTSTSQRTTLPPVVGIVTTSQKVTTAFLSTTTLDEEVLSFALTLRLRVFVWFVACAVHAVVM